AAEKAYNDALVSARAEAGKIVTAAKADIQADLNKAIAKADAQIAAKATESAGRIDEIRAGAQAAISEVAKDTAKELVSALGGTADARSITAAVTARLKG
ncbi:MAG: F0F1 ATP synthase subunit B', partial [Cypionkella sp.]|nr:F0F1 ATP synthase subunit B' [Cypionkella sp.]